MKIKHKFIYNFSEEDVLFLSKLGFTVEKGYDSLEIEETNINFQEIKSNFQENWKMSSIANITYTQKELDSAEYLEIWAKKYLGYAKPDDEDEVDDFEYPFDYYPQYKDVFEIEKTDPDYGVLKGEQIGNYQMKGNPKWGTSSIASLFGAEDSFFVTEEVYNTIFKPLGIKSKEVINYVNKKVLPNIVQIIQEGVSKSPLHLPDKYIKETYEISNFGISKYLTDGACPPPMFIKEVGEYDFFYTQEYFGSGGITQRNTIISQKLYQELKKHKVKGLNFAPLMNI